jgi:hypothetical protein
MDWLRRLQEASARTRSLGLAVLLVLCGLPSLSVAARNAPHSKEISAKQAERLAGLAVKEHDRHPTLQPFDGRCAGFYFFEELNVSNPNTSVHILALAVNQYTGDVWAIDGICHHLWPKLTRRKVAALRSPRSDTPWQCDKEDAASQ